MPIKYPFFLIILFYALMARAQTCTVNTGNQTVCIGNALNFSTTFTSGLSPVSYEWDFGNGVKSAQAAPSYNYTSVGYYTPNVKITFSNNSVCLANGNLINVVSLPKARFVILNDSSQCFKYNSVCIKDSSVAGLSGSPIVKRTFLWGDGNFDTSLNYNSKVCNSYINTLGGTYSLVMEATDSNGCLMRYERKAMVTIFPKMPKIVFANTAVRCDTTLRKIINSTAIPFNKIKKFTWIFGDSIIDSSSTKWLSFNYLYINEGTYLSQLIVTDIDNCTDTASALVAVKKKGVTNKILITTNSKCYKTQNYVFNYKDAEYGDNMTWRIFTIDSILIDTFKTPYLSVNFKKDSFIALDCGKYILQLEAFYGNNCKVKIDTTFEIYGPKTILGKSLNDQQCSTDDTVYFRFPGFESSCLYKNLYQNFFWDFNDGFAPPCTTDTKNGINIGINCAYSKDSTNVKHKYSNYTSTCYNPKLTITDPVLNCTDTSSSFLALSAPNASPNLPARRGLYYYTNPPGKFAQPLNCSNYEFVFRFEETLPSCSREELFLNLDSAAGTNNWKAVNRDKQFYPTSYPTVADSNGWVTVGIIIKNGNCYDTAWYHNMFKVIILKPEYEIIRLTNCAPYLVKVQFKDSIQKDLLSVTTLVEKYADDIRNPMPVFYDFYNQKMDSLDSLIHNPIFNLKSGGKFRIKTTLVNKVGCEISYISEITVGFEKRATPRKEFICLNDSLQFLDDYKYMFNETNYWKNQSRTDSNLERIWYKIGDTSTYKYLGINPKIKFSSMGNYKISLIAQDSLGCKDTLVNYYNLNVGSLIAGIKPIDINLLCAPKIVPFYDNSLLFDSIGKISVVDNIIGWKWDFGDNSALSFLENPVHDYLSNGTFSIKLQVNTIMGCVDTANYQVTIKGPKPKYLFASGDTIGCSPVNLRIANTTGSQLKSWQWEVDGPSSFAISTKSDSTTGFTLTKAGRYRILLLGTDSFTNQITGQTVYCTSIYPDTLNPNMRPIYVTVFDKPLITLLGPDTVCANELFSIKANADTVYKQFVWKTNTGYNSGTLPSTDSIFNYSFKDSGNYIISLVPTPSINIQCIDSPFHVITVRDIKADFEIDASQSPVYSFTNKSISASFYNWNFGQPKSGSDNFSTLINPTHDYKNINDSFTICLIAYNTNDCYDNLCKSIPPMARLINIPNVFTPNNDGINDAFDIEILGQTLYDIKIYNRWGGKVFESTKDGKGNDGINWNGKTDNVGNENVAGVYFYIFKYKFQPTDAEKSVNGSITLIRN